MTHSMARGSAPGALRPLTDAGGPDAWASRLRPRLPGGTPRAIKWVIINAPWYEMDLAWRRVSAGCS